ncbi:MAG: hypothetical protein HQL25_01540 [Candidatus Omnitrophica bacterium]|nr:hypothetical protein [Candidatus Omnitrophota bacterium]
MFNGFKKKEKKTKIYFNVAAKRSWIEENFHGISKIKHPILRRQSFITDEGIDFGDGVIYSMELTRRIAANLNINMRQVIVGFSGNLSSAAVVQRNGTDYFIEIDNFFMEDKRQIAACLSHEISHVFLKDNNLEIYNGIDNERYTDLMTIYLGMGIFLLNGLTPCTKSEVVGNEERISKKNIKPYLTNDELGYALALYAQIKSIKNEEIMKLLFGEGRDCFRDGVVSYMHRKGQLLKDKDFESAVVLCPFCFQRLRIKLDKGCQDVVCGNCRGIAQYNTDCYVELENQR